MLFSNLAIEMFPGRSVFLTFLEERHFDRQTELAKEILLRLAYQARTFPPNKLIYNLLKVEAHIAGTSSKGPFVGRDHFVHLVNLYLLGVYVFWYHDLSNKKIVDQFANLVQSKEDSSKLESKLSVIRSFLAAWRDFVLFHDLGYPWEASPGLGDDRVYYLKPFGDAFRYGAKDAALFVLSQLLALIRLRGEETPSSFQKDVARYLKGANRPQDNDLFGTPLQAFCKIWNNAQRLSLTTDAALLRLLQVIIPKEDLLPIVESDPHGHPVDSPNSDLHALIPPGRQLAFLSQFDENSDLAQCASENRLPTNLAANYRWAYYVREF